MTQAVAPTPTWKNTVVLPTVFSLARPVGKDSVRVLTVVLLAPSSFIGVLDLLRERVGYESVGICSYEFDLLF